MSDSDVIALRMGALHAQTRELVFPRAADKRTRYHCPECGRDAVLCSGPVRAPYFRHRAQDSPCSHYDRPGESWVHRNAKIALRDVLRTRRTLAIVRRCASCERVLVDVEVQLEPSMEVHAEHRFVHRGQVAVADVACASPGNPQPCYVFEVCHTHPTHAEARPEPWFELRAEDALRALSDPSDTPPVLACIRAERCESCTRDLAEDAKCPVCAEPLPCWILDCHDGSCHKCAQDRFARKGFRTLPSGVYVGLLRAQRK